MMHHQDDEEDDILPSQFTARNGSAYENTTLVKTPSHAAKSIQRIWRGAVVRRKFVLGLSEQRIERESCAT
jgi:hypothetical protein